MANENNPSQDDAKKVTIFVNGTPYEVDKGRISYEQLLALIKAPPLPEGKRYALQFSKGHNDKPTGTLFEGESVEVKKDMEFDVTPANRS
jgi:Multiubiquitin